MSNVFSLRKLQIDRQSKVHESRLAKMDKLDLLTEMVRFQEIRCETSELTIELIAWGLPLFKALHVASETPELAILTRSYLRELEYHRDR